jgi:ribulose bisphosphate carboxylase small subunit
VGSINYLRAIRPDTAYLKKIIENSLLSNWAISIEYQIGETDTTIWQLWDKTYFAIRSAEAVLDSLIDCYTKHSRCAIRINAEKYHPQSRILYTVYNPQYLPADTDIKPQTASRRLPAFKGVGVNLF